METYSLAGLTKKIYDCGLSFFSLKALEDILGIQEESTFFETLRKLNREGVLEKVERGKYLLKSKGVNELALANFLYSPSYVSLESALSFYGIISQFTYEVTSVTPKKPVLKRINGKVFSYAHLQKGLFWGYEKKDDFLIALPEKALLDQLYLGTKGLKNIDLSEYDLALIKKSRLSVFLKKYSGIRQANNIAIILKKYSLI
jgi:hypothetical protein